MARAKDLAALAGLGALAYAMRNKDKPEQESKGRQSEDAGYKSTETREDKAADEGYKSDVLKAITTKREAPNDQAGSEGVIGTSAPAKPKSAADNTTSPKYPGGVMGGTRPTPSTVSSSAEGMKNYKPRRSVPPVETKTSPPVSTKLSVATPAPAKSSGRVPTSEEAAANRQALYDKVKSVGSGVVDYVKNFETPAERAARERKAASGMKRGGAVKKMAKGGMTSKVSSASSRADGIASRGKTKCKMY